MNRTEWDRARVEQYAINTDQTLLEAQYYLHRIYTHHCDVAAVDAKIDPVVDEMFQSQNRPIGQLTS